MNILYQGNILIEDVVLTQAAEHEEELMKSDFVRLSWDDAEFNKLPADAYIIPFNDGIHYSLLEPYEPEQKNESTYHYEPAFQHPKMYLGKVPFIRPSKDSSNNDIDLLDWSYTGYISTLMAYFCEQMNTYLGMRKGDDFVADVYGITNDIITVQFQSQDILSALSNVANVQDCEWHIDWKRRRLYFGHIALNPSHMPLRTLEVGVNVGFANTRNSKEGFWNTFLPQGSTRNISRRVASGENVQSTVRLSLDKDIFPDGKIYTDDKGNIITKEAFDERGVRPFIKSLIFEDVYPRQDLYVYNVRFRERYLMEETDGVKKKVVDYYKNGSPVYKKYAIWYVRLAYPTAYDALGTPTAWKDYEITNEVKLGFDSISPRLETNHKFFLTVYTTYTDEFTALSPAPTCDVKVGDEVFKGCHIAQQNKGNTKTVIINLPEYYNTAQQALNSDEYHRFYNAAQENDIVITGDCTTLFPGEKRSSVIIDGKEPIIAFQPNKNEDALDCPLAGRGDGDGEGHYGFKIYYHTADEKIAPHTDDEIDTGVVIKKGDFEIVYQQKDDYILPTTNALGIVPKGESRPSIRCNKVNMYNVVISSEIEKSAKAELLSEAEKEINRLFTDNDSYTIKTYPDWFEEYNRTIRESYGEQDPMLFIGQSLLFINGGRYTSENPLQTRVMKLVTKIDYDFEQEITIGNAIIKGSTQQLKDQVETLVSAGAAGAGGGGGISLSAIYSAINDWVTPRFLSKLESDTAQGEIGFIKGLWIAAKGLFGFDSNGNIKANNLSAGGNISIGGDLTVDKNASVGGDFSVGGTSIVGDIMSRNYTGDGIADTGYRLTMDDGSGSSALTVDNLHVRRKLTAEELEVKKETAIAGNQVYSCAANVIARTDYLDASGNILGYSKLRIPWLLRGMALVLGKNNNFLMLGRHKTVRVVLDDVSNIKTIRCYFLAKDGNTEVNNLWEAGGEKGHDLVRCQTMNIKNTNRRTYLSNVFESKVGNVFWWRKAVGKSTTPVVIDEMEYHYVDVSWDDCAVGSDIPAAGDHIVQFGNDSNTDRMNVKIVEVNGSDAPADKWYRGIYTYSLNNCYWGGNTRKAMISPASGFEFFGPMFNVVTEYGSEPISIDRGLWNDIPIESDEMRGGTGRKCYYGDKVSHSGCYWKCVFTPSGNGIHYMANTTFTYNGTTYTEGSLVPQGVWAALPTIDKPKCTELRDYTVDEPSTTSPSWLKVVDRGTSVKSVIVTYAKQIAAQYDGNPPTSGWQSTIDAVGTLNEGDYLWTKTVTSYSDTLEDTTTYTVSKWGIDGDGIDNIETKFYEDAELLSQEQLAALTESSWKEYSQLALTQGDYIYTRTKITYDKADTPTVSYQVNRIGQDGVDYVGTEEYYCLGDSMTTPPTGHPYQGTNHQPDIITPATMASRMSGGSWSEARPTYDTSTEQGRAKKYLWNFEAGYTTEANEVQITEPICIANYEKGITSIIETYAISASAVAPSAGSYPSDITSWTDEAHDCAPTDAKPYQWNKTETTYTDGTKDTFYHVSAVKGTKGNGIVSITRTFAISSVGTTSSETTEPSHQGSWTANSPSVTEQYPYLWAKEDVVFTDTTKNTTKYYCIGGRGDNGVDAQDIEWVYIRTKTNTAPTILNDNTYTDTNGKTYTSDDHLPQVSGNTNIENNQNRYQCTDDPKGVTEVWMYEWEIKRTKGEATNGHRSWDYYQGTMTLHNNFAQSAFVIDIDNDNDQFGTDSESKVLVSQTRSTTVKVYDGTIQQTLNSLNVTLTYEDNTSVPTSVATSTSNKNTGVVSVTVLQSNTAFSHEAIKATITAEVSGKGTKTIIFTIQKVKSGQPGVTPIIYQLAPTQLTFSFSRDASNNLTPSSRTSQINVAKTEGNTTTILSTAQSGITYKWGYDNSATATESNKAIGTSISVTNSNASSHYQVWVELSTGDRETLPIIKDGAKGSPGDSGQSSFKSFVFKRTNDASVSAPTGGSYSNPVPTGWSDGVPEGNATLWCTTRIFTSDGLSPQQNAWTTPRIMTDTSDFDVEYSSVANADQYPPTGHPNTNTKWSNTASTSTIWMATSEYHNGVWSDWQVMKVKGEKGNDSTVPGPAGKDGWTVTANPANVIITQSLGTDTTSFSTQAVTFSAKKGNTSATITSLGTPTWTHFTGSKSGTTVTVTSPTRDGNNKYYTEGKFVVTVNVTDPDTNTNVAFSITVPCYANLLGTWKETVQADTKTAIAQSTLYEFTGDTSVSRTEKLGEFIASSKKYETKLTSTVLDANGNVVKTSGSLYQQTSDSISMSVKTDLQRTGIDIDNGTIKLQANKVTFCDSSGGNTDKIWIDNNDGTLHAVNGVFSGSLYLPFTIITRDNYEQYADWWNPSDHTQPFDIDFSKAGLNAQINYIWIDDNPGSTLSYDMQLPYPFLTDYYGAELQIFNARTYKLCVYRQRKGNTMQTTDIPAKSIYTFKLVDISHLLSSGQSYGCIVKHAFDYKGVHYNSGLYTGLSLCWVVTNKITISG